MSSYADSDMPLTDDPDDVRTFAAHGSGPAMIEFLVAFMGWIFELLQSFVEMLSPLPPQEVPPPSRDWN